MWTKIDSYSIVVTMDAGDIITTDPNDPKDQYEIESMNMGFIKALHSNGKTALKIFPESALINNWWVNKAAPLNK